MIKRVVVMANRGHVIINRRDFLKIALGAGAAATGYKLFQKDIDRILYGWGNDEQQPRTPTPAVNATPRETPIPNFDYYDPDYKVGVMIEGDEGVKDNIKNLITTWKEITPDDYKDKYPYAPKRIFKSPDGVNAYGGSDDDDYIRLNLGVVASGDSNDLKTRLRGTAYLRAEWHNAKRSKTGVRFASGYDAEMDSNRAALEYLVMTGVITQKEADSRLENISKRIYPNGTYKNQN